MHTSPPPSVDTDGDGIPDYRDLIIAEEGSLTDNPIPTQGDQGGSNNCVLGSAYSPSPSAGMGGCGNLVSLFNPIPNCDVAGPDVACIGSTSPGLGGLGQRRDVIIHSAEGVQSALSNALSASASGYGVEASGSMTMLDSNSLSTTSGAFYKYSYGHEVKSKRLNNIQALELADGVKKLFREGPDAWFGLSGTTAVSIPYWFVTELHYGGYFSGGYTFTSNTADNTNAFEAASEISGNGWGVTVGIGVEFNNTRSKYSSSVSINSLVACSPATCLDPDSSDYSYESPQETGLNAKMPKDIVIAYDNWVEGLKNSVVVSAITVASLQKVTAFIDLIIEDRNNPTGPKWNTSSLNRLALLPTPNFISAWQNASFDATMRGQTVSNWAQATETCAGDTSNKLKELAYQIGQTSGNARELAKSVTTLMSQQALKDSGDGWAWDNVTNLYQAAVKDMEGLSATCHFPPPPPPPPLYTVYMPIFNLAKDLGPDQGGVRPASYNGADSVYPIYGMCDGVDIAGQISSYRYDGLASAQDACTDLGAGCAGVNCYYGRSEPFYNGTGKCKLKSTVGSFADPDKHYWFTCHKKVTVPPDFQLLTYPHGGTIQSGFCNGDDHTAYKYTVEDAINACRGDSSCKAITCSFARYSPHEYADGLCKLKLNVNGAANDGRFFCLQKA